MTTSPTGGGLHFCLLGPLEVFSDGQRRTPNALKPRTLLALLLLHANELVSTAMLVDSLWDSRPPHSAKAALQMYVTALRRALRPSGQTSCDSVLHTHSSGYLLRVGPEQTDLGEFRRAAARGRARLSAGKCAKADRHFRRALAAWRGPALADLRRVHSVDLYCMRLDEERLVVLEDRLAADLCIGRCRDVVGELRELCASYPLRESFYELQMLALCLTGRRAEALGVYTRAHRILIDQVGIGPGPALRAAQRAILDGPNPPNRLHAHRAQFAMRARSYRCPSCSDLVTRQS